MSRPDTSSSPLALTWEEINCPLCGDCNEEILLQTRAQPDEALYTLVGCRGCGMVYLNPRPDPECIGRFYPEDYAPYHRPIKERNGWWDQARWYLEQLVLADRYHYPRPLTWWQKALARLAGPWFGPARDSLTALPFQGQGRLLDYGCGSGSYAARMRQRGWTVTGMDFSPHAAEQARTRHGLKVLVGALPHPTIRPESFDMVTMGTVLEHVHWPHQLIGAAVEALRPGGVLVVSVPNIASWGSRVFGKDWWPLDIPLHLLHFTPTTLCHLLGAHGLEIVEMRGQVRHSWMRRSFERAAAQGSSWARRLLGKLGRLRPLAGLAANWSGWVGKADSLLAIARRPLRRQMPALDWRRPATRRQATRVDRSGAMVSSV